MNFPVIPAKRESRFLFLTAWHKEAGSPLSRG
jgi:hypothetical protein